MGAKKLYQVREFADMAGVTVRTLQYYDRIGVLEPSVKTDAQHRLYARHDLLKLQQILTLKQLGFTLREIKQMIQHPDYDLRTALKAQKQAIDAQIEQLQQVSSAMDHAMDVLNTTDNWDWDTVQFIIQGVTDRQYLAWVKSFFTDEQLKTLAKQSQQFSPTEIADAQKEWVSIAQRINQHRDLPPDHPTLQEIAEEAHELIQQFTQDNEGIKASLTRMYNRPDKIPLAYKVFDDELMPFYRQVMNTFYKNKD